MAPAGSNTRSVEDVRRDLESEREQLASAAEQLRQSMNVGAALRSKLPLVAVGALGAGFFLAGGIGATARLLMRRGREGQTRARAGRFRLVDDD
jgi:hypothetical protein